MYLLVRLTHSHRLVSLLTRRNEVSLCEEEGKKLISRFVCCDGFYSGIRYQHEHADHGHGIPTGGIDGTFSE